MERRSFDILSPPFRFAEDQWLRVAEPLAATGEVRVDDRERLENRIDWWLGAPDKRDAKVELETITRRVANFEAAAGQISFLLPASGQRELGRLLNGIRKMVTLEEGDLSLAVRRPTLADEVIWAWYRDFGRKVARSTDPQTGKRRGPLVRFVVAATAPVEDEAVSSDQAAYRINRCRDLIASGAWSPSGYGRNLT